VSGVQAMASPAAQAVRGVPAVAPPEAQAARDVRASRVCKGGEPPPRGLDPLPELAPPLLVPPRPRPRPLPRPLVELCVGMPGLAWHLATFRGIPCWHKINVDNFVFRHGNYQQEH